MLIKRRVISDEIELKILVGIIVSTSFARKIIPTLKAEYFTTDYIAKVFEWCKDFYSTYKECPGKHIQDIYEENKEQLEEAQQQIIEKFLTKLSKDYEQQEEFNVEYLIDQAVTYIEEKSIRSIAERTLKYLEHGKSDKAKLELQSYKKVAKITSDWVNPFNSDFIKETYFSEEEGGDNIFIFPGALGKIVGYHQRDWLVAVLAPMKRGKSFFLMEMAFRAFMNHKRVVFFSLEMSEKRVEKRLLRRITAHGKIEGEYLYPTFDCLFNQNGECVRVERTNKIKLLNGEGNKPVFNKDMKYKPCIVCRGNSHYQAATWFMIKKREKQSIQKSVRKANSLVKMYGDNFRLKSYPAGTANINDLISALDYLEYTENFIPDAIIVDYADILKAEDNRLVDPRAKADSTWIKLKGLADSRHCLVITASQGTRKSIDKKSIGQTDIAEDIRKLAHIDVMYGLSQTQEEKLESIMRINVLANRDEDSSELKQVICLQQRGLGQVLLDTELAQNFNFISEDDSGLIE
jgi:replicative DNA helicase